MTKQMSIICFTTLPPRDRRGRLEAVCREEGVSGTMSSSLFEVPQPNQVSRFEVRIISNIVCKKTQDAFAIC